MSGDVKDPVRAAAGRLNILRRTDRPATPEQVDQARRELAAAKIEKAIQKALAEAPPLSAEQQTRLAALFTGEVSR